MLKRRQIIPLDGSPAAEAALMYSEAIPSEKVALLLCLPPREEVAGFAGSEGAEQERRVLREDALRYLENAGSTLQRQGREVEHWLDTGDPAERIVTDTTIDDLVIMTTHGFGAGRRAVFGSVADRVVRHAAAPVLVVRGGDHPVVPVPLSRIVVPLDGSELAELALPIAVEIAADLGLPIRLLRALDVDLLQETVRAGTYASAAYAASVPEIRASFEEYLDERAKELISQDLPVTTSVLDGPPAGALLAAVDAGDLLVMTTHGRSGIRRWMLGSVAEKMVRLAPVPVLIVRDV